LSVLPSNSTGKTGGVESAFLALYPSRRVTFPIRFSINFSPATDNFFPIGVVGCRLSVRFNSLVTIAIHKNNTEIHLSIHASLNPKNHNAMKPENFTLRQYAAIHLRIPDSGLKWLDEMIDRARIQDAAVAASAAAYAAYPDESNATIADISVDQADATMHACDKYDEMVHATFTPIAAPVSGTPSGAP